MMAKTMSDTHSCITLSCTRLNGPPLSMNPMRLAGTWQQYSKKAIAQLKAMTPMSGQLLLYSPSHAAQLPWVFIPFLLLSWLAVRTGLMLSSLAVLLLSALMAWGTVQGMGPFHRPSVHEGLALLWGYMATLMVVALLLSALVAELSANERRWQFALEGADTGVWDWHARSQRIQYSPRWRMLLGVSAAELGNKLTGWETRVHPDDLPAFIAVLAGREQPASSHELRPHGSEIRLRAGNGQWRWYGLRS